MKWAIVLAALALVCPTASTARIDPSGFGGLAFQQHPGGRLPIDTQLRDETGDPVTLGTQMGGRPSLIILEYLRCQNLCSLVLSGAAAAIVRSGLAPGKDLSVVAISIDPNDTPKDTAASEFLYRRRFPDIESAERGVHFLTGSPENIARIASAVGFPYRLDRESEQYAHPAGFVIATADGRISRYMLGLNPPAAALREAIADAQLGKVTPAAHPLLLLCFGYDPDAGTAAALAMRLVRLAYLAAILIAALIVGGFLLKRRSL